MGLEITVDGVPVPKIPALYMDSQDGHEWIAKAAEFGWSVPPSWGERGWALGHWPLMIVALYDSEPDSVFALVSYTEGDLVLKVFASSGKRDRAVTEFAVACWRSGVVTGPDDLPATGYLPHHHGPYRE